MKLLAVTTTNSDCNARLCYQEGWKQKIQFLIVCVLWFYVVLCIESISGGAITNDEFKNVSMSCKSDYILVLTILCFQFPFQKK